MGFLCMVRGRPLTARVESIWDNVRPTGRPYEREVSRSDGEVAIEKIKKPLNRRLSRQLPSRGALRDVVCAVLYE